MADINALVDNLSGLTVLEVADLVKKLEEKWGVSAAAPVAVAAAAPGGGGAAAAAPAEEKTAFDVILKEAGRRRLDSLATALEAGDKKALKAVEAAGEALGVGLATLMNLFDEPTVELGGSYAVLHEHLKAAVQSEMDTRGLAGGERHTRLVASPLGEFAVVRGAAGLITRRAVQQPERLFA